MMKKLMIVALGAALAGGLIAGPTLVAWAQADVLKARNDNRKATMVEYRIVKKVLDDKGNPADTTAAATKLLELQKVYMTMFPAGSDKGETKALPVIWTDWAGFLEANKVTEDAMIKLIAASKGTDLAALGDAFKEMNAGCTGCHKKYHTP